MKPRLFHCPVCKSVGPCIERENSIHHCAYCGEILSQKSLKQWNPTELKQKRRSGRSVSSRGEQRQRKVLMALGKDEKDEARTANQMVISILMAFFFLGAAWAFYQWYNADEQKSDKTAEKLQDEASNKQHLCYVEINVNSSDGKHLQKQLQAWLSAYFSEASSNARISYVYNAAILAPAFDQYYILQKDDEDWLKSEIERIIFMKNMKVRRYLLKVKCPKDEREIVMVETDDGLKIDWEHLVSLGSEGWESFLKSEEPMSHECRVYGWLVNGGLADDQVYLLRVAAPSSPGSQAMGAQTPVMRVDKKSSLGMRVKQIFEELPPDTQENGAPQLAVPDPKYRRLQVRLKTSGKQAKVPEFKLEEIKAGDWFTLNREEREKCLKEIYKTETPLDQKASAE